MGVANETEMRSSAEPFYLPTCEIQLSNGFDFYATASFNYWEAFQENMNLGLVSNSAGALDLVNGDTVDLDFEYKPGFQVGAGMLFNYDNWETFFNYTWYRGTVRSSVSLNSENTERNLLPAWEIPNFLNPQYHHGRERWTLKMDLFDWVLARSNTFGKALCMRYFFGLRGALIKQSARINYTNVNPAYLLIWPSTSSHQKSSSWGIGPEIGLSSKWDVGKGLYLQALGELDVIFTQYDLRKTERADVTVANRYRIVDNNVNYLRTHTELNLGLGWGIYLYSKRYHLDFLAEYGFQVFFDQNMFIDTASTQMAGKNLYPNGNLYLHGLTITGRFDF